MAYTINRRYNVRKEISGDGAASRVLLVDDALRGSRACALKLLSPLAGGDYTGARREFETLRSLRHPLIAEVYDFGRVEEVEGTAVEEGEKDSLARPGDLFITFSYIDGLDLRQAFLRLFPRGPEDPSLGPPLPQGEERRRRWHVFYEALAEVAIGLHAIHSRGLVHHDVKPQNLLLVPRGHGAVPERFEVKVIDLDLARPETTPLGGGLRGTLPFVAPEVLSGAFADRRSDLYSLGVSIVWALSGRPPFSGSSVEDMTRVIQSRPLPRLREVCPGAAPELEAVVGRLTQARSEDRFPDAMALVAELERIGGFSLLGRARSFRAEVPPLGWERELGVLSAEVEALSVGESAHALVLLEADEGCFASALLEESERAARLLGVRWVWGRAQPPALHPYQPVAEVIQALLPLIDFSSSRYRRFDEALASFLPGVAAPPVLSGRPPDPAQARLRFFDGVTEFLLEAGREAPFVLCLRNLERCDDDTLDLLEFLARNIGLRRGKAEDEDLFRAVAEAGGDARAAPPPEEPSRLLLVAHVEEAAAPEAMEPGEESHGGGGGPRPTPRAATLNRIAQLAAQPYARTLRVEPLVLERVPEWLGRRSPGLAISPRLAHKVHERSAGSPRLLDEIARWLGPASQGNASPRPTGGGEDEAVLSLPDNLHDACLERLAGFGSADQELLHLLAAARTPLSLSVLARLEKRLRAVLSRPAPLPLPAGEREAEVHARIRRLVDEGFLEVFEAGDGLRAAWAVDSVRGQVYRGIPDETKTACHEALYEELLLELPRRGGGVLTEDLAFHALRAGRLGPFLRFAFQAAEAYRRAHAHESAVRLLEEVLSSLSSHAPGPEDLPDRMSRDGLRWLVLRDLAEIYQGRRNFPRAIEKYTVLLSLEEKGPDPLRRAEIYRRMGEVYGENRDASNALFFLEKGLEILTGEPPSRELVEGLMALAVFHLPRGQLERAESAAERALTALGRVAAPDLLSRTYSLLAAIASRRNDHPRSLSLNQKALEQLQESEDLERQAEVTAACGDCHLARGDYEHALEEFQKGLELAGRMGSKHLQAAFHNQLGTIHFNRANHYQALEFFRRSLALRRELGDLKGIANSYNNLGLAFRLRDDLARASECYKKAIDIFARIDDQYGLAAGMNNLASILELEGKYGEALEYSFRSLEKKKRFNSKSGIAFSYYRIGKIYQSKGELDKALVYAEKSLHLRREIGERMGIAYSLVQLAELFLLSGRLFEAFQECQRGQAEFERVENALGRLVAREVLARILTEVGILDEAAEILHEVLDRARAGNQQEIVGAALLDLSRLAVENARFEEAEAGLERAETLFRDNRKRREHAEALLERCALALEQGQHVRASEVLEDAYEILEALGIRDLVPHYFLLRGRIEIETAGGSADRARKFLERGLVEAREVHLPHLGWQIHHRLALLLSSQGEAALAQGHLREAEEVLARQYEPLPLKFRERFWTTRRRAAFRGLSAACALRDGVSAGPLPEGSPAVAVASASPPGLEPQIEEVRSLNKRLLKLQEISQAITSELDLHRLLEKLMDSVLEMVNAERGFLILRSPEGDRNQITVARNLDREMVDRPELKISRSITDEVIRTGRPLLSNSAIDDERFLEAKSVHNLRLQSILCVPLLLRDQVLGAIYLDNRLRKHAFSQDDLQVLETFGAQAAVAITNARLSEEIKARNLELEQANRQMEVLNQRLVVKVNESTAELKVARERLSRTQGEGEGRARPQTLVGNSKRMLEIFALLDRVGATTLPVLISGESGTGKELIANAIHQCSPRRERRFISENCAALSETLLESELFGHTRGAFTGAVADRKGLFELAHGGTLFLDEVGDMSLAMQKKLLRVLEEGEIRRVGGKDTIQVDARIISASNQDLKALVDAGKFREDLYYRLHGIAIEIPPLRERKEDIPGLVQHFLEEIARDSRQQVKGISTEALRLLISYDWPGNVRELRHFLERTVLLATGPTIEEQDCLFDPVIFQRKNGADAFRDLEGLELRPARDRFIKHYLEQVFEAHGRNVSRAARAAGISRESFHRLLKRLEVGGRGASRRAKQPPA